MEVRTIDVVDGDELPDSDALTIVVTISRIDARLGDDGEENGAGWTTLSLRRTTLDLLSLQGATFATLGITVLPAGGVERLRLVVDPTGPNYVVTPDGVPHPLVISPEDQAGILVVGDFDVAACAAGHVTLAFAGRKSLVVRPVVGGTEWTLRPVVRLREVVASGSCPVGEEDPALGPGRKDKLSPIAPPARL
jgi:hypothetical protein